MLFSDNWGNLSTFGSIVCVAIIIVGQIPYYCLNVRRLHDMNKDETLAYVLLGLGVAGAISGSDVFSMTTFETLAYCVETIAGLYLLFFPGTYGKNKYGADPLG